jgi:excinuclease ABC subunit C
LLQRIRDEAHRWANGYHQLLLSRRVEQSLLDQCPGISETRKAALLKEFGSVTRLRRVDAAAIAKRVEGIGAKLAADIVAFLKTH